MEQLSFNSDLLYILQKELPFLTTLFIKFVQKRGKTWGKTLDECANFTYNKAVKCVQVEHITLKYYIKKEGK